MVSLHEKLNGQLDKINQLIGAYLAVEQHLAFTQQMWDRARVHANSLRICQLADEVAETKRSLSQHEMVEVNASWKTLKSEYPNLIQNAKRTQ